MTSADRNRAFKSRLSEGRALLMPGVPNPLFALAAADVGYEALYLTGAGVSNMNLGLPDLGLSGLEDMTNALVAIRGVVDLPLVVDADTGFGNAVNAYHAVRRLEAAGASAIQLEDQVFPKRCGHFDGKAVVPIGEMLSKLHAALDARQDSNLLIIARTDAVACDGFEAGLERAQRFVEAGADITFVEALRTEEQIAAVPARLACPQIVNIVHGGKTPPLPFARLDAMGYALVLYANAALQGALSGAQTVLRELHASGSLDRVADRLASFDERQRLVDKPHYDQLEAKYAALATVHLREGS